ncbi:hypothetical protein BD324DRAFT_632243 [Kockovaella imperatae]|uniref:RRM domain-containing protein n=1 Tax=Kockovaella imperatae TaxID=4999 RepID=A0A1Y1UB82_9TREE|nr:hypothetical protein BD324DRAFT_632243 [Kockovaella imperatae]ORX35300.1 hypothetical protein BD324DRAFT_632243 [Kockovaella imperatae]
MAVAETVQKRLHVAGLIPSITPEHLKDRFKSFGTVNSVEWPGPDALGQPRRFAYVSIESTLPQLKKCLNIMSGSTWRGAQLRIAEAKPNWAERLEKERRPSPTDVADRLRKRRRKILKVAVAQGMGKEAQDMRDVTLENYSKRKFWTLTSQGTLVRPLALRPSHPLPPPSKDHSQSSSSSSSSRRPPTRSRRRVINPTAWNNASYEAFDSLDLAPADPPEVDSWIFESEDDLQMDEYGYSVIGHWRRASGSAATAEEEVKVRMAPQGILDGDLEYLDDDQDLESTSDLFDRKERVDIDGRDDSPLFAGRPLRSASPQYALEEVSEREQEGEPPEQPMKGEISPRSPIHSPVPPVPAPPASTVPSSGLAVASPMGLPTEIRAKIRQERSRDLSILDSILGSTRSAKPDPAGKLWFEESDSDTEERQVLRLRGGAAEDSESEEEESSEVSDDTDDSDDGEDEGSDSEESTDSEATSRSDDSSPDGETDAPKGISTTLDPEPVPLKPASTLKDMFASTSGGGSLLAHLGEDIEMDEAFDVPLTTTGPVTTADATEDSPMEMYEPAARAKFIPDPSEPLFYPTFEPHLQSRVKDLFTSDREDPSFKGFWAQETDAEMREIWDRDKLNLTREWKRRHREAKKHRRRKGGGAMDDME